MIPPIRRQPAPVECATPPDPTPHIQAWPRPPRTHFWHRPRPHAAPSPLRRSPAPEPHPDEKGAFCGRFAGLRPVVLRERVGFQSNAQMRGTRSTGNLRVRRERGRPGGTRRWVRPLGPVRAPRSSSGCVPARPERSSGWAPGPAGSSRRAPHPPPDPWTPSPAGPRAPTVKICHKGPDRAGAHEKKR